MKTKLQASFAILCFFAATSCTKETTSQNTVKASAVSNAVQAFKIGQTYKDGIIFYIDNTGQHGLIAAKKDQGTGISWNNGKNIKTGATGLSVGTGADNSHKIIAAQGTSGSYAALLCSNYVAGSNTHWYLPSRAELNLMYQQKNAIGNFAATNYWSSSETGTGTAWDQEFGGGFKENDSKSFTLNVRAISSF